MKVCLPVFLILFIAVSASAQTISYADISFPDKKLSQFEIIGKTNGLYAISKQIGNRHFVSFYNAEMKEVKTVPLSFITVADKLLGFALTQEGILAFTQQRSSKYLLAKATLINATAFESSTVVTLDSLAISKNTPGGFYFIKSRDASGLMLVRINKDEQAKEFLFDVMLVSAKLEALQKKKFTIPSSKLAEVVETIGVADNSNFYFVIAGRKKDGSYIKELAFYEVPMNNSDVIKTSIPVVDLYPDRVALFIDNKQNTCTVFSFASSEEKGNIDGFFTAVIHTGGSSLPVTTSAYKFLSEEKQKANKRVSTDIAFNDFYISDVVTKAGGGFIVIAECLYTASRETNINRWQRPFPDGWRNIFNSPLNFSEQVQQNSIAYGTFGPDNQYGGSNNRLISTGPGEHMYNSENIVMLDINEAGQTGTVSFLQKLQQSGIADEISYVSFKKSDAVLFFYNEWLRTKTLLNIVQVNDELKTQKMPVLKGMLQDHRMLNRLGVQVSNNEIIIPTVHNNHYVFSLVRY